jgi:hypothetical protein
MTFERRHFKGWIKDFDLGRHWHGPSRYIPPPEQIGNDTYQRLSVYFWCWSFMRLSPALLYARVYGVEPQDPGLDRVIANAGDLSLSDFGEWWRRTGMTAFAELKPLPQVQPISKGARGKRGSDPDCQPALYLEVPLTIRRGTIIKQVKALLNQAGHVGKDFDPAPYSTAPFPLYTLRYRVANIERRYWVLLYRMLYPDVPVWMIGARLGLAPTYKLRKLAQHNSHEVRLTMASLHSLTGRHLYKARYMLAHLARGDFPRDSKIDEGEDWSRYFGHEHAEAYKQFVEGSGTGAASEWIRRIKRSHMQPLREHVAKINRVAQRPPLSSELLAGVDLFMRGESDSITAKRMSKAEIEI